MQISCGTDDGVFPSAVASVFGRSSIQYDPLAGLATITKDQSNFGDILSIACDCFTPILTSEWELISVGVGGRDFVVVLGPDGPCADNLGTGELTEDIAYTFVECGSITPLGCSLAGNWFVIPVSTWPGSGEIVVVTADMTPPPPPVCLPWTCTEPAQFVATYKAPSDSMIEMLVFCGQDGLFPRSIESLLGTTFVSYDPGRGVATILMGSSSVEDMFEIACDCYTTTLVTEWELIFSGTQGQQNFELAVDPESSCDNVVGTGELRVDAGYVFDQCDFSGCFVDGNFFVIPSSDWEFAFETIMMTVDLSPA